MTKTKWIVILIVGAIGPWGCGIGTAGSDDSGPSDGADGSDGSTEMACNNESDLQATIGTADYAAEFWGCYDMADADVAASVDACIEDVLGVSGGCAGCLGALAGCIDSSCGDDCNDRGPDTRPCQDCIFDACNMDFNVCSGIAAPSP